jgi:hypothetical protein
VLASGIGLDSPKTEHVDPAIEAGQGRYDVEGVHGVTVAGG